MPITSGKDQRLTTPMGGSAGGTASLLSGDQARDRQSQALDDRKDLFEYSLTAQRKFELNKLAEDEAMALGSGKFGEKGSEEYSNVERVFALRRSGLSEPVQKVKEPTLKGFDGKELRAGDIEKRDGWEYQIRSDGKGGLYHEPLKEDRSFVAPESAQDRQKAISNRKDAYTAASTILGEDASVESIRAMAQEIMSGNAPEQTQGQGGSFIGDLINLPGKVAGAMGDVMGAASQQPHNVSIPAVAALMESKFPKTKGNTTVRRRLESNFDVLKEAMKKGDDATGLKAFVKLREIQKALESETSRSSLARRGVL